MNSQVLIPTHEFAPQRGGIATYLGELGRAGHRQGDSVLLWVPKKAELLEEDPPARKILGNSQSLLSLYHFKKAIRNTDIDWGKTTVLLGEPGPLKGWLSIPSEKRPKAKALILLFHGSELQFWVSHPKRKKQLGNLLPSVSRIGVVSHYIRHLLLEAFPQLPNQVVVVPGGLGEGLLSAARSVHSKEESDNTVLKLLTVGRIHPRKGQDRVIEALGLLSDRLKVKIQYQCAGPIRRQSYFQSLHKKAEKLGVSFVYAGIPEEEALIQLYREADGFVLASEPSKHSVEGLGLVLHEAGAFGLSRIVTDHGGMKEVVKDGASGWVVPSSNAKALAKAIEDWAENPDKRWDFGQQARAASMSEPTWECRWKRLILGHSLQNRTP